MEESTGEEALQEACIPGVRIWGPVPRAQAIGAGALAAASSVLIAPRIAPARLYERLTALVPDEVLPKVGDTAHTLRQRLATSAFLHPSHVLAKGHGRGGRYIALNDTTYPQPRRVQWARPPEPEHRPLCSGLSCGGQSKLSCTPLLPDPPFPPSIPL